MKQQPLSPHHLGGGSSAGPSKLKPGPPKLDNGTIGLTQDPDGGTVLPVAHAP
jgi:hypothetical protein